MGKAALTKDEIQERLDKGFIHVRVIIEMLGAPKEHVEKTLKMYVDKIKGEGQTYRVLTEEYSETTKAEDKLWTQFVEMEFLAKDASAIVFFCFDYMPSSIEIMQPSEFRYRAADFSAFFNDFQNRLHTMDRFVKEVSAQHKALLRNSNLLLRNNVMIILTHMGELKLDDLATRSGIPPKQLEPFLEQMIKEKYIKKKDNKYALVQEKKPKKKKKK